VPTPIPPRSSIGNVTVTNDGVNLYTVTFDYFNAGEYGSYVFPEWVPTSCTGAVLDGGSTSPYPLLSIGRHSVSLQKHFGPNSAGQVQCSKVTAQFLSDMNHTQLNIARVSKTVSATTNWSSLPTPIPSSSQ